MPQSVLVDSCETIKDSEGEPKAPGSENIPSVRSGEPSEGTEVFSLVTYMLEDDHKH